MLTSSANQYLRPEYLSPIQGNSIELDAKKSPLALLAQTCSQIGADLPQKNQSNAFSEKAPSKGKSSPNSKSSVGPPSASSPEEGKMAPFKPYEKKDEPEERGTPKRTTPISRSPPSAGGEAQQRAASRGSEGGRPPSKSADAPTSSRASTSPRTSSPSRSKGASSHTAHGFSSLDLTKDPLAAYKLPASLYSPLSFGLDPLGAAGLSALTTKVPSSTGPSLSSPYVGYARVKTASGSETIVPICRDPYCTNCQINNHTAQVVSGTCPPGCSQCAQIAAYTKNLASLPGLLQTIPPASLSSLYPSGLSSGLLVSSHQPYVCSWISGDAYCGKRFSSPEDLLQHLRTHTNLASSESALSLHAFHHPLLGGHLARAYPSPSLSPLSAAAAAAAAARYHPYAKPPLSHLPSSTPLPGASAAISAVSLSGLSPHPLSAYYSPYGLYARGLGTPAGIPH